MKLLNFLVVLVVGLSGYAIAADEHDQALIERIKGVGEVCQAGANCDASAGASSSGGASAGRSGADVAAKSCNMCHTTGMAGAPSTAADWKPRLDAVGMDALVASAISGKGAMPPKGGCMDCSDAELRAAVEHMVQAK